MKKNPREFGPLVLDSLDTEHLANLLARVATLVNPYTDEEEARAVAQEFLVHNYLSMANVDALGVALRLCGEEHKKATFH